MLSVKTGNCFPPVPFPKACHCYPSLCLRRRFQESQGCDGLSFNPTSREHRWFMGSASSPFPVEFADCVGGDPRPALPPHVCHQCHLRADRRGGHGPHGRRSAAFHLLPGTLLSSLLVKTDVESCVWLCFISSDLSPRKRGQYATTAGAHCAQPKAPCDRFYHNVMEAPQSEGSSQDFAEKLAATVLYIAPELSRRHPQYVHVLCAKCNSQFCRVLLPNPVPADS